MRICFFPRNIDGAGWYRCFFPAHYLEVQGHFARAPAMGFFNNAGEPLELVNGQLPEGWVNCGFGEWPDADIYVMQMPLDPQAPQQVKELQEKGKKVVVELDDDYLHLPPYNPFTGDSRPLHKCVQLADAVSVSTPSLKSSYKHLNKNITVLRNRLYWPMWDELTPVYEQTWRKVRVGYMGVFDFHSADLQVIRPWFGKWMREHPEVEFVSAGDPRTHDFLDIPVEQRVSTDRPDFRHHELGYTTATFDIGLVPLAKNKFNEGKSYLKGLEYAACGIPSLASPTAQYREFVDEEVTGFLCATKADWLRVLDLLTGNRERLVAMGKAARARARGWTYEHHIDEWLDFYQGVGSDLLASRALWVPERVPA